ncbi:IspD/TarI family cytidylyltransferase [Holdemania massiliensis]|uniref:IspD/TarI family cytidylyltransferase n=1 Tax=Holdemania massiliensis TaxID=1468449 RepID=UPI0026766798|nr:IspD/TarI family cytidylyltransferase [Holdemania massiliensis]
MKNIALIIAGGVGMRTHQDIPKQFINVKDVPVIVYTLKAFQNHPLIDAIEVVCIEGWHDVLWAYAKQFGISKLENIVNGGETGQDSIRNGLKSIAKRYKDTDDIVLIHDSIRPMVSAEIITDNIDVCRKYGNATTVIPCTSVMLTTNNSISSEGQIPRDNLKITQTPQAFFLNELLEVHKKAITMDLLPSIASCALYIELGKKVYLSRGSEKNIKITTSEDIEIFQSLLESKRPEWLKR